jgi:hypothetical protein
LQSQRKSFIAHIYSLAIPAPYEDNSFQLPVSSKSRPGRDKTVAGTEKPPPRQPVGRVMTRFPRTRRPSLPPRLRGWANAGSAIVFFRKATR